MQSQRIKTLGKWLIAVLIGIGVGIIVYVIKKSVDTITEHKFEFVKPCMFCPYILVHYLIIL